MPFLSMGSAGKLALFTSLSPHSGVYMPGCDMVCGEPSAILYTYLALPELSDVQHLVELAADLLVRPPDLMTQNKRSVVKIEDDISY